MSFLIQLGPWCDRWLRFALACWGGGALWVAAGAEPPAPTAPGPVAHAETGRSPGSSVPPEVDQALRARQELLSNANLLASPTTDARKFRAEQAAHRLEIARQQRERQELAFAKTNLVELVTGDTPPEIRRSAILELALLAQDEGDLIRAQQVFSQFISKYQEDPSVPEILLRQGLLYRQMGAYSAALSKLFAVMGKSLNIDSEHLEYYQHLVLQAKTEIADTYLAQGRHADAADYFSRLLKLDEPRLNRPGIRAKLVRCFAHTGRYADLVQHAETFLEEAPDLPSAPEIRYEYAKALRKLGREQDALAQVLLLLQRQEATAGEHPTEWDFWRLRVGNDLANQLYGEGDYLGSLQVYQRLADLNPAPAWQVPVWYQIGLAFERLRQPVKAMDAFAKVAATAQALPKPDVTQHLTTIIEMAHWRRQHLDWAAKTEVARKELVAGTPDPQGGNAAPLPK